MNTSQRVVFDEQIFIMQKMGGVSRYFSDLIAGLLERENPTFRTELSCVSGQSVIAIRRGQIKPSPTFQESPKIHYLRNTGARLRSRYARIHHQTYYHRRFLKLPKHALRVATVHDMIPEKFPEFFLSNPHLEKMTYLRNCHAIVSVSESTRADLLNLRPELEPKVFTIPLGVRSFWFDQSDPHAGGGVGQVAPRRSQDGFLLFVGARDGYKNFDLLLTALAQLGHESPQLVVVGRERLSISECQRIHELDLDHVVRHVDADDEVLRHLYASAIGLVYPSRYEGFGLPVLEAMAAGCPVLASRSSSLPEVGAEAALYFEPESRESLLDQLNTLIGMPGDSRIQLCERSRARALELPIDSTVEKTARLYEQLF